jgi:hypothetical protein
MTQLFTDNLGVDSLGQHEAGTGMAAIVHSYALQPCLPKDLLDNTITLWYTCNW